MKKNKVLQSTFISTAVLFALARPLFAEINDGVVNFSNAALGLSQPPITTFDAPGAGTDPGEGTLAFAINPAGTIAGQYFDSSPVTHSFLRARDGTFTEFDAPGGGTGPFQGTFCSSINPKGAVTGF